jgi:hypothetical protein
MTKFKKAFFFLFGLLIALSSLFICIVTIEKLFEPNCTEEDTFGALFFLFSMPFVGLAGALLAYRNRPQRRRIVPMEHMQLVKSLIRSRGGRLSMTDILGSIQLAREEAYSALDALTRAKEGKFGDDEFGAKIFELSPRADHEGWIREALKRFIISSSKLRIAVSFVFIIGCIGVLVTGIDEGCCGNEAYFIIVIISSLVILSGSYVISHLKKGKTGQLRSWVDK